MIPLHNACSFGHAEVVQLLLRSGGDANARDNWNYTPLHEAAIKGKIDVCIGKLLFLIFLIHHIFVQVKTFPKGFILAASSFHTFIFLP